MANLKISQLTPGAPAQAADVLPIDRGGANFSLTAGNLQAILATADQGFFISNGLGAGFGATGAPAVVANPQEVRAIQFVLPFSITVSRCTSFATATAAASTFTFGIYSADRSTKLIDSGTFDGSIGTVQTKVITPVTLPPGVYWFAQSASTQTTLTVSQVYATNGNAGSTLMNALTNKKCGLAANAATAGVLPSALGAITALQYNPCACLFEP